MKRYVSIGTRWLYVNKIVPLIAIPPRLNTLPDLLYRMASKEFRCFAQTTCTCEIFIIKLCRHDGMPRRFESFSWRFRRWQSSR